MELNKILLYAVRNKASDVHLTVGIPPVIRVDDELIKITENVVLDRITAEAKKLKM